MTAPKRLPWSSDYQCAVNRILADEYRMTTAPLLSPAEMNELGEAMHDGTTPEQFAARVAERHGVTV